MKTKVLGIALACLSLISQPVSAAWPDDKPIELVVGFAAGGGTDVMARVVARFVEKRLGDSARIVVVNKPGSGGELAASYLQHAKPDGYTLGMINVPGYLFLPMFKKTSYQPENIRLLARIVDDPAMLVANKASGKPLTLKAVLEEAKRSPKSLTVANAGEGTTGHLAMLQLEKLADVKFTSIPFKGVGEAKIALLGGHVDYLILTTGEAVEVAQPDGKLAGIALWADKRTSNNVPTAAEQGYPLQMSSERGVGAPLALPDAIAAKLEAAFQATLADPAFLQVATADAPVIAFMSGAKWDAHLQGYRERLKPLLGLMGAAQ